MPLVRPQVLNDVFQQAADQARQKLPAMSHNRQVCKYTENLNHLTVISSAMYHHRPCVP